MVMPNSLIQNWNKLQAVAKRLPTKNLESKQNQRESNDMNQIITPIEAEQAFEQIIKRAQSDRSFRQLCLDNPNLAAKQATGKDIPQGFTLNFVDNRNADLTVVLPDLFDGSAELSDVELEQVAGGGDKPNCAASCGVSCGYSDDLKDGKLDIGISVTKK